LQGVSFRVAGDRALAVSLGEEVSEDTSRRVQSLYRAIQREGIPGLLEAIPTYCQICLYYDPLITGPRQLQARLEALASGLGPATEEAGLVEVPICFDGECALDLGALAKLHGIPREEIIDIFLAREYLVFMLGFLPGQPYLGVLDERLETPRLPTPRSMVAARAVGIAGRQVTILSYDTPSGWHYLGRTPLDLFDVGKEPPVPLKGGDRVRFVRIDYSAYHAMRREVRVT
jgi:inhibitor of KinA